MGFGLRIGFYLYMFALLTAVTSRDAMPQKQQCGFRSLEQFYDLAISRIQEIQS
jgi:hypothetical protein